MAAAGHKRRISAVWHSIQLCLTAVMQAHCRACLRGRELHTGRYNFLHRSWGPIEPFDDSMPELLKKSGVYTHLISDHQHYWEDGGATYHTRYNSWECVRGQEGDPWKAHVGAVELPPHLGQANKQDEVNRAYIRGLGKQPLEKVFGLAHEFLNENRDADNWLLHIEPFDPHEPFFAPEEYQNRYSDDYNGTRFDWPPYDHVTEPLTAQVHCRNQYGALLTMCDAYLGKLLDYMDVHRMWQDTMLIVATDHGFLLGEHGWWAKNRPLFYEELSHTPAVHLGSENRSSGRTPESSGADYRPCADAAVVLWRTDSTGMQGHDSANCSAAGYTSS